jgi:hypothetical protein
LLLSGCELEEATKDDAVVGESRAPETSAPAAEPAAPAETNLPAAVTSGVDELDISSARMLGPHKDMVAQNASITRDLYSANKEGGNVRLSFETLGWPSEGSDKKIDGGVYLFWEDDGGVIGGLFDWHAVGQTVKTLANVNDGYLDGRKPASGATIWFCIVNMDADERTSVVRSDTPW